MIYIKSDVPERLKNAGYTTYRLQREKILSSSTLQKLIHNGGITTNTIDILCKLLQCQPSDIIAYRDDEN